MTIQERISISDDIGSAWAALEKARYIQQEIHERFFSTDPDAEDGALVITYNYPRYAVFSDILGDLLNDIAAILPTAQHIDSLPTLDAKEAERA